MTNGPRLTIPEKNYVHWRRERDSNPRYACDAHTISNRAPSTTRTSLHGSPSRTRTCDNSVNSRVLYQLSYQGKSRRNIPRFRSLVKVGTECWNRVSEQSVGTECRNRWLEQSDCVETECCVRTESCFGTEWSGLGGSAALFVGTPIAGLGLRVGLGPDRGSGAQIGNAGGTEQEQAVCASREA